jgi:hypothetical protein
VTIRDLMEMLSSKTLQQVIDEVYEAGWRPESEAKASAMYRAIWDSTAGGTEWRIVSPWHPHQEQK